MSKSELRRLNIQFEAKIAQLEAEKEVLREGIIRTLQLPIGAVLDRDTRLILTDALKEEDDARMAW